MQQALSIEEAATAMSIGKTKLYELINSGQIKARKIGIRTIILKADLDTFLFNLENYSPASKV